MSTTQTKPVQTFPVVVAIRVTAPAFAARPRRRGDLPPHVTLVPAGFLTESEATSLLAIVRRAASGFAPFTIEARGGCYFDRRDKTIAAVNVLSRSIFDLRERILDAMIAGGLGPKASPQYVPHVTIATIAPGERLADVPSATFPVTEVAVFYAGRVVGGCKLEA